MGGIQRTGGKGSARFVPAVRAKAWLRWTADEIAIVERSITLGLTLEQTHALLPYRSRDSVKIRFYELRPLELREKLPRDKTDFMDVADVQKDAAEGSARLLQALIDAFAQKKAG